MAPRRSGGFTSNLSDFRARCRECIQDTAQQFLEDAALDPQQQSAVLECFDRLKFSISVAGEQLSEADMEDHRSILKVAHLAPERSPMLKFDHPTTLT